MKRATELLMDEYQTSQKRSCCHRRLEQARLLAKVVRKDGDMQKMEPLTTKEHKKECEDAVFGRIRGSRTANASSILG